MGVMDNHRDQTMVFVDLLHDPTYPRTKHACPMCGHTEAVFFQSKSKGKDATMKVRLHGNKSCILVVVIPLVDTVGWIEIKQIN